jgi:GT2 family glycosyltransferase
LKLSVIIVNYNVSYFLEQCLRSVERALKHVDGEVWVVDNASVDDSVRMVKEKFPWVNLIENEDNVGFSKANNQAIRQSNAEYVLLLNPDTVIEDQSLAKSVQFMDNHTDCGGLGVRMVDGKGNFLPESKRGLPTPEVALYKMFGLNKLFPKSKRFGKYHLSYLPEQETNEVDVLAGAYMMLRNKVLDEIGLLDETFFMYGEDIDLSYRIQLAGYKNYYFADTTIIHYKGESTKRQSVNYVFVFYKAMIIFAKKHYSGGLQKGLTFLIQGAIWFRVMLALISRFFNKTKWVFIDAAIMWIILFLLKDYWEEHIKGIKEYPRSMITIHFPYYTFTWLSSIYLSGGYRSPYDFRRLIRGLAIGTVIIAAIYGLLPNELRHSRGIILFGTILTAVCLVGVRMAIHYLRHGHVDLNRSNTKRTVIVGHREERERGYGLLQHAGSKQEFLGFVTIDVEPDQKVLGTLAQMKELIQIYRIQHVIFCGADMNAEEIIQVMHELGPHIDYKIIPPESSYIIGSNSKNQVGEFYAEAVSIELENPSNRRKKRSLDVVFSLTSMLLFPILVWFKKTGFWSEVWQVLQGKKTWIGYHKSAAPQSLPKLKPSVYGPNVGSQIEINPDLLPDLNAQYAKSWSPYREVELILLGIFSRR